MRVFVQYDGQKEVLKVLSACHPGLDPESHDPLKTEKNTDQVRNRVVTKHEKDIFSHL